MKAERCQRAGCKNVPQGQRTKYCGAACYHEAHKKQMRDTNYDAYQPPTVDPRRKLTERDVRAIRINRQINKTPYKALGKIYGVSDMTIIDIVKRRTWKTV